MQSSQKKILGKESPESFDNFQELKYNDVKGFGDLKDKYDHVRQGKYLQEQFSYTYGGEKLFIPKDTVFETVKTIAGKDSATPLRDKERLSKTYGGNPSDWNKRVGKIESLKHIFDMHWYELDGKQYEMKLKHRGDR